MMATMLTRKQSQAQTRERLLAAAAEVFGRLGYHRATVQAVADEGGFTIGAVYSNFAGKEELFLALADRYVDDRVAALQAIGDSLESDDPGAEIATQLRDWVDRDPRWPLLFYEFWSLSVRSPELQDALGQRRSAVRDALAETLERVADRYRLELRFPAPALATAALAALNGLAFERAADPQTLPADVFVEFVTAVLGCAITAPHS